MSLLLLAASTLVFGLNAAQTVDGRVLDAATGTGIPGVAVILREPAGRGDNFYRATTDTEGRFRIPGVEDASYIALYRAAGFWTSPFVSNPRALPAFPVGANSGPVHLEGRMYRVPKISGRVLDPEGKPVPHATVWALDGNWGCDRPSCFGPPKEVKPSENGDFLFAEFDNPGTWVISAAAPGWAQTFYPGVTDPALAERLDVQPGVALPIVDIRLTPSPMHKIRGHVLDAHGDLAPNVTVNLFNRLGPVFARNSDADGAFEFDAVPVGEWRLSAKLSRDPVEWSTQSVSVRQRDLDNVELRLSAPFSLQAKVVWEFPEGISPPDPPSAILAPNGVGVNLPNEPRMPIGRSNEAGGLTFESVYPGHYEIIVMEASQPPFYLDSIRLGDRPALGPDVPILSDAVPLTITYKFGGGTVRGTIENCGAARVVLIPYDPAYRQPGFFRVTECRPNGQFEFTAVRPGDYYGFAIVVNTPTVSRLADESLLARARQLTVRNNEHTTGDLVVVK